MRPALRSARAGRVRGLEPPESPLRAVQAHDAVVELEDVGRQYGTEPPVIALRDVNLTLERGDSLAIVGPSGSGKSTMLNVLGCLDRPTSGVYRFEGIDTGALGDDARAALRAHRIGFV